MSSLKLNFVFLILVKLSLCASGKNDLAESINIRVVQELRSDRTVVGEIEIIDSEVLINLESFSLANNVRFECNSTHPVEWVFDGPFYFNDFFSARYYTYRVGNGLDPELANVFSAHLVFRGLMPLSTGNFVCRNPVANSVNSSVYAYFSDPSDDVMFFRPGEKRYIPWIDNSKEIFHVPSAQSGALLPLLCSEKKTDMIKFSTTRDGTKYELEAGSDFTYNSRTGLWLNFTREGLESPLYGSYELSGIGETFSFKVLQPTNEVLQVIPNRVTIDHSSEVKVEFSCMGKEFVSVTFSEGTWPPIEETEIPEDEFPFQARWEIIPSNYPYGLKISCYFPSSAPDVVHTWVVRGVEPPKTTLTVDKVTRKVDCCTDSPNETPSLTVSTCSSVPDCRFSLIEQMTQPLVISKPYAPCVNNTAYSNDGTIASCVHHKFQVVESDYVNSRVFSHYNDTPLTEIIDGEEPPELSTILDLRCEWNQKCDSFNVNNPNSNYRMLCVAQKFYFAEGLHWAFQFKNGTFKYLENRHEHISTQHGDNFIQLGSQLIYDSEEIDRLYCFAPRWNSLEWSNVSISITFPDDSGASQNALKAVLPVISFIFVSLAFF